MLSKGQLLTWQSLLRIAIFLVAGPLVAAAGSCDHSAQDDPLCRASSVREERSLVQVFRKKDKINVTLNTDEGLGELFRTSPFLMSHDSATGFMGVDDLRDISAQAQFTGFTQQLDCGVRAIDIRTVVNQVDIFDHLSTIQFFHGSIVEHGLFVGWVSDQTVKSSMPEITAWARTHPDELVVLVLSHCYKRRNFLPFWEGMSCTDDSMVLAFADQGIKAQMDCNTLNSWTLYQAKAYATMDGGGGKVLLIPGEGYCVDAGFDSSVTEAELVQPYLEKRKGQAASMGRPYQTQALIQQNSIAVPVLAHLNEQVSTWSQQYPQGLFQGVNFLEVNMACSYGTSISENIGAKVSDDDRQKCKQHCKVAWEKHGACRSTACILWKMSILVWYGMEDLAFWSMAGILRHAP
ncbi:unnamed protein product [Polarella glacialis]|uniref:Uncharacterized protein n=1 Tax=Polarella glacialis TaxID=89957 RepID=A0A813G9Q8_POLGL|nr:unnamed protein product [Polarella glacialis]CAE8722561.1 unnamed protein product [Polarella glacialis]